VVLAAQSQKTSQPTLQIILWKFTSTGVAKVPQPYLTGAYTVH
jgi:hypothetical protein